MVLKPYEWANDARRSAAEMLRLLEHLEFELKHNSGDPSLTISQLRQEIGSIEISLNEIQSLG